MLYECNSIVDQNNHEILTHGTNIFPIACYDDDLSTLSVPWHWHDEIEIAIIIEGSIDLVIDTKHLTISKGEGFFVNSAILHSCTALTKSCRLHSFVFHPRLVGGSPESIFYQKYLLPLMENSNAPGFPLLPSLPWQCELLTIVEQIWLLCTQEPKHYELLVRNYLSQILILLYDNLPSEKAAQNKKSLRNANRIKTMLAFIEKHYAEEIRLPDIAASANLSESECLRCFSHFIQTTPMKYLSEYRLEKARFMLESTSLSITEIASRCGFQSDSYFVKLFRERMGMTPGAYRRQ